MSTSFDPIATRLAAALEFSQEAGRLTLRYFQTDDFSVERKSDNSPVTQADRSAELLLRERIGKAFANDGVIGEEFGQQPGTSGYDWILDPIDGTKSFISGVPLYSQLIGIVFGEESVAGVIHVPALDECVFAGRGQGAWWRRRNSPPRRAQVSKRANLAEGIFLTSQVDNFAERGAADAFERLQKSAYITRTWGDGYGYLLVATGRADAMVDPVMNVWDAAAIQPVLQEAGGTFTDWQGRSTIHGGEGIGTNGMVLEEVLAITRQYKR
jgi:histidinol-phosphatase